RRRAGWAWSAAWSACSGRRGCISSEGGMRFPHASHAETSFVARARRGHTRRMPPVLCEVSGGIATLTLNRPEKLNAINYAMIDTLLGLLDELEADGAVRALIVTGAGDRAFSAGGDIAEFSESIRRGPEEIG